MTRQSDQDGNGGGKPVLRSVDGGKGAAAPHPPGWAGDLRKLYDAVLDEPLPDSFADLLKKLDQKSDE
jgi:hypothetical protein